MLSLVPSLVNVVSAACERADNKAPQNGNARSSDVASLPLRLEVYNSALVRPTFYPCLAAGKLSKEVEGELLPSFLLSFLLSVALSDQGSFKARVFLSEALLDRRSSGGKHLQRGALL